MPAPDWNRLKAFTGAKATSIAERAMNLVNGRRTWIIHPPVQVRIMTFGVVIALFALGVTYGAQQYLFWKSTSVLREAGLPLHHPVFEFVAEQERVMSVVYLGVAALAVFFGALIGLVISHRVAGPLYRMKMHLLEAAGGRAPRLLKFRDRDYFQELADAYNAELRARGRIRRPGSEPSRAESLTTKTEGPPNVSEEPTQSDIRAA